MSMIKLAGLKRYRSLREALRDGVKEASHQHEETVKKLSKKREMKWPKESSGSFATKT